jgi:hypothetical protein
VFSGQKLIAQRSTAGSPLAPTNGIYSDGTLAGSMETTNASRRCRCVGVRDV